MMVEPDAVCEQDTVSSLGRRLPRHCLNTVRIYALLIESAVWLTLLSVNSPNSEYSSGYGVKSHLFEGNSD